MDDITVLLLKVKSLSFLPKVLVQRGITGDVKFTLFGYRNITNLDVKEITGGQELQVGNKIFPFSFFPNARILLPSIPHYFT